MKPKKVSNKQQWDVNFEAEPACKGHKIIGKVEVKWNKKSFDINDNVDFRLKFQGKDITGLYFLKVDVKGKFETMNETSYIVFHDVVVSYQRKSDITFKEKVPKWEFKKKKQEIVINKCGESGNKIFDKLTAPWNERTEQLNDHFDFHIIIKEGDEVQQDVTKEYEIKVNHKNVELSGGTGKKLITFNEIEVKYTLLGKGKRR